MAKDTDIIRCSFCRKASEDTRLTISSPSDYLERAYICDACIEVCNDILAENGIQVRTSKLPTELDLTTLGIKPPFKTVKFELNHDRCFHLCPFMPPFNEIYTDHVAPAGRTAGFDVERADEIFGTGSIIEDVWQRIGSSGVITADVTGRNPNVMYEIGMAHTLGKPVVIMTQTMEDVPFDLRQYRCLVYQHTPRGCTQLEEKLTGTLLSLRAKRPHAV